MMSSFMVPALCQDIVRLITKREIMWAGHVVLMWERKRGVRGFGGETRTIRDHLEELGVDGRIVLKWIFRK